MLDHSTSLIIGTNFQAKEDTIHGFCQAIQQPRPVDYAILTGSHFIR
jgi:hypothetical protein